MNEPLKHEMLHILMRYGPMSLEQMAKIHPQMNWKVGRSLFERGFMTSTSAMVGKNGRPAKVYEITDTGREFWNSNQAPKVEKTVTKVEKRLYEPYVPEQGLYRNDGHSHIKSKGFLC